MPNSTIAVLRHARSELERKIAEIDTTIKTLQHYAPETREKSAVKKQNGRVGGIGKQKTAGSAALDVLDGADEPMTTEDVANEISERGTANVNVNSVNTALTRLEKKGMIESVPDTRPKQWVAIKEPMPLSDQAQSIDPLKIQPS